MDRRGVTVYRKCDSYQVGVKCGRDVCHLMETVVRKYDSPQEGCQFVGRCDGHGEM